MSPTAPAVRGACPSVHRPFHQLDGELLRIRVPGGILSAAQAAGLAALTARVGAGLELTGRANLQVRGLGQGDLAPVVERLAELGLVHPDPEVDQRRNLLASPTAGFDPDELVDLRPLLDQLTAVLVATAGRPLAPSFGLLVDGGGSIHLRGRPHPVALGAVRAGDGRVGFEVRQDGGLALAFGPGERVPVLAPGEVAAFTEALIGRGGEWPDGDHRVSWWHSEELWRPPSVRSRAPLGLVRERSAGSVALGAMPVLGRLSGTDLARLARVATEAGNGELRLTPWRSVLLPGIRRVGAPAVLAGLGEAGFVVSPDDPAAGVVSCAGAAGCPSGSTEALADARSLVRDLRRVGQGLRLHVSGCEKRCAGRRLDEHDLTLVGGPEPGRYRAYGPDGALLAQGLSRPAVGELLRLAGRGAGRLP